MPSQSTPEQILAALFAEHRGRPVITTSKPIDANVLMANARRENIGQDDASAFADLVLAKLQNLGGDDGEASFTTEDLVSAIKEDVHEAVSNYKQSSAADDQMNINLNLIEPTLLQPPEKEEQPGIIQEEEEVDGRVLKRCRFTKAAIKDHFGGKDPLEQPEDTCKSKEESRYQGRDIIGALCERLELAIELGKHLRPSDMITLYCTSRAFHNAIRGHLMSTVRVWVDYKAPEAARIFPWRFFRRSLDLDPLGRSWANVKSNPPAPPSLALWWRQHKIRLVPGLRYLQLVVGRDRYCREILAMMAREGHRMPKSMYGTLLRLWLLLEISTTRQRSALLRNKDIWTDFDLYNAQMFFVKFSLLINSPWHGPTSHELLTLFMGQKGLYPLWQLLMRKRFTTMREILRLKTLYDYQIPQGFGRRENPFGSQAPRLWGVPLLKVGQMHKEGWGAGAAHLSRPEELIPVEAVSRGVPLQDHIRHMTLWGHFSYITGENLVPTEEEIYISDEEEALSHIDTSQQWQRRHALKKRFDTLTPEQQKDILDDDADERLRLLSLRGEEEDLGNGFVAFSGDESSDDGECEPSIEDEVLRGYHPTPQRKDDKSCVPTLDDQPGWRSFTNEILLTLPPNLSHDQALKAEAHMNYSPQELNLDGDWLDWLPGHSDTSNTLAAHQAWADMQARLVEQGLMPNIGRRPANNSGSSVGDDQGN